MDKQAHSPKSRLLQGATTVLIFLCAVLIAVTAYLFVTLQNRQAAVLDSVRENAMWAVFQTHRESSRLVESILVAQKAGTPQAFDRIRLNFDLLYSRIALLEGGFFLERFTDSEDLNAIAGRLQDDIRAMADAIDGVAGNNMVLATQLNRLLDDAHAIQGLSNTMVLTTNRLLDAARAENRSETSAQYGRLMQIVAATAAVFVATIILQFTQLRLIWKTHFELEDLSRRNAQSAKAAHAASEAKSMFLATMSHEIRTPLNGIIGAVDLLEDSSLNPEQARRALTIRRSGHLLLDVINDILDFTKLDAKGITYQTGPVSLPQMADILHDVFRQRLQDAGLALNIEGPYIMVSTDDVRLRQVLLNLIGNAIKFTPSGTITLRASVPKDDLLRIEVEDTGIGIPPDEKYKLFQDFSQLEGSLSRRFGGTGLGLAISKRIVTGLGGTIGVQSTQGKGSTFWLEIPVEVLGEAPSLMPVPATPETRQGDRFDCNVLVVEDNEINREVAKALFERFGATVTTALHGQDAVERIEAEAFDLVIMDIQMPVMDGLTATRVIRDHGWDMPIVGLSANAFTEDETRCLEAGMTAFVPKPISRAKVLSILQKFGPPMIEGTAEPALDLDQMEAVRADIDDDLFAQMLEQLRQDGRALLQSAQSAADIPDLDADLHALKGATATLGLSRVARDIQNLRDRGGSDTGAIQSIVDVLDQSVDEAFMRLDGTPADGLAGSVLRHVS